MWMAPIREFINYKKCLLRNKVSALKFQTLHDLYEFVFLQLQQIFKMSNGNNGYNDQLRYS